MAHQTAKRQSSVLSDVQGSSFGTLAQTLGSAPPPGDVNQLLQYLGQFLAPQQMELVRYMFQQPQQFQQEANIFPAGVTAMSADIPVAADNAAAGASAASTTSATAQNTQTGASTSSTSVSPYEGASGFTRDGKIRLAPNDPDAQRLLASNPNLYVMGTTPAVMPEPKATVNPIVEKPAEPTVNKVAQPRLDTDPDGRVRMFMKDGSQTYWNAKDQSITPTAERVNSNQAVRYTITLPNGQKQNIY